MIKRRENIFVVGTDTGVGKTVLSLLLMQFFYARGDTPFYLKPAQTGCVDPYYIDSDARFIYQHVKPLNRKDPADSVVYCFKNPKAPYCAARDEGEEIDFKVIQEVVNKKRLSYSPVILEAAGGLLVPVNEKKLVIDMIEMTCARPIIAARAGLGTINHTLLTLEALSNRGIEPARVIFLDYGENGTSREMISENIEVIEKESGIKVGGVIGKIKDFSNPSQACYQPLEGIFGK
ncbi:MAG: dethiobiotin synthase [Thermodesulfobacteriota bacterium]|nr:dethiobiotin synthase [Thermodesulfobacteriota bacterium]